MTSTRFVIFIVSILALGSPLVAAADMTSTNYHIYADTVGVNGGDFSSSASYNLQDTLGESPAGFVSSTTYDLRGGYQAMEPGDLSISISKSALNLGELTTNQVNSDSTVATVTSAAATGYSLSIGAASGSMPASVTDGAVTAGSEEYGFSASGNNAVATADTAVAVNTVIAAVNRATLNDATTIIFKASRASGSAANTYSQSVTLTVSANF